MTNAYKRVANNIYATENGKKKSYRARKVVNGKRFSFTSDKLKNVREWLKSI